MGCLLSFSEEDFERYVATACKKMYFNYLKNLFDSEDGAEFNVFQLVYAEYPRTEWEDEMDVLHLVLYSKKGNESIINFLNLVKHQAEKNKSKKYRPQFEKHKCNYIERLLRKGDSATIQEFNFLLENTDIFPLKNENDPSCSTILHALCENRKCIHLLQDYLSSGQHKTLDNGIFLNSNNDGEKMRHPTKYHFQTPIQIACSNLNIEAVKELVVNNIGGANFGEAIETLLEKYVGFLASGDEDVAKTEKIIIDICLSLLSQANAERFRNHTVESQKLKKVLQNSSSSFGRISQIKLEIGDDDEVQLSTVVYMFHLDKLYECLMINGCAPQKPKLKCRGKPDPMIN